MLFNWGSCSGVEAGVCDVVKRRVLGLPEIDRGGGGQPRVPLAAKRVKPQS